MFSTPLWKTRQACTRYGRSVDAAMEFTFVSSKFLLKPAQEQYIIKVIFGSIMWLPHTIRGKDRSNQTE